MLDGVVGRKNFAELSLINAYLVLEIFGPQKRCQISADKFDRVNTYHEYFAALSQVVHNYLALEISGHAHTHISP